MSNFRELLKQAKAQVGEVEPEQVKARLDGTSPLRLLDVREEEETANGIVPGAATLSRAHFESRVEDVLPDKAAEVVVYCQSGVRSVFAARTLQELGYQNVTSMRGGFLRWKDLGYPFEVPRSLDRGQRGRYSRHLILPEVGEAGQLRFLNAKVLCVGAGGLGSPALLYLAAAGIGTIGIVDSDVVEENNLQRQVVHNTERLGTLKAESAKATIEALNPDVNVVVHPLRLDATNARDVLAGYDVVLDGTDNFDARYVINDAAVALRIPVIHGSIFRFEGMASTFVPFEGPCYSCLYPEAPPPELAPSCSEAGVLGVLPGIVGSLQANEVLKLVGGYGEPLVGRLMIFDARSTRFSEVRVRRDPACPVCGEAAQAAALASETEEPERHLKAAGTPAA
ncbi:MAG: molybdopterin-synthase adenylyltransferase MoeB [Actinomycetota bacterium]|nr:molybdopterin-synthase adenylyltransferase MoeB [Actinomycetota bacterium]